MQTIGSAVAKLKELRAELARPSSFFESQLATQRVSQSAFHASAQADARRWIGIAQATARDVIYYSLPADTDPQEWALLADYIASQVSIILAPGGSGVVIFLGPNQAEFSFTAIFGPSGNPVETLTLEQVTEYVEAGLRGDPMGKPDISDYDQEKTPQQTAMNILRAFYKRSFAGEREQSIVQFVEQRSLATAEEFFPAILEAWYNIFSVIARDDFKIWIEQTARRILQ